MTSCLSIFFSFANHRMHVIAVFHCTESILFPSDLFLCNILSVSMLIILAFIYSFFTHIYNCHVKSVRSFLFSCCIICFRFMRNVLLQQTKTSGQVCKPHSALYYLSPTGFKLLQYIAKCFAAYNLQFSHNSYYGFRKHR